MNVFMADEILRQYVADLTGKRSDIRGIYLAGSYLEMKPHDELNSTSDIDLVLIVEHAEQSAKIGKINYHGLILEISYLDTADFLNQKHVLLTHYIGNALIHDSILYDPEGVLLQAQRIVEKDYAKLHWVNRRIEEMLDRIRNSLDHFQADVQNPACVNSYLFTLGISVFPFLLADCRNLTVRKRYAAAREVLFSFGYEAMYEKLIGLIAGPMNVAQLHKHLEALEYIFDRASSSEGKSSSYAFRQDIRPSARQIAIGGCHELFESLYPRESIFWIGATFARCYTILQLDHLDIHPDALLDFLGDTGIHSAADMQKRLSTLYQLLPEIEETAKSIASTSKNRRILGARHENGNQSRRNR